MTELLLSKASDEFLNERDADSLARLAAGAFSFLDDCRPDRVDVQVFNPDTENEGWEAPVTVIRTNLGERPFVVDTVREFLHSQGLSIEHYVYPVLMVERADDGSVLAVGPSEEGGDRESFVHCEVTRVVDGETLQFLRDEIARRLQDVIRSTNDFGPMVDALNDTVAELAERTRDLPERSGELTEIQDFLRWLRDGGFVFLGYRAYDMVEESGARARSIVVEPGSGLGILRNEAGSTFSQPVKLRDLPEGFRSLAEGGPILIISKTNAESTVHRRARMDYIGVKKLGPDGDIIGEHRFLGLFTSRAYTEDAESIPILRQKLAEILERSGVKEGSHDYKETITIFNSMAKEELFLTSSEKIGEDVRTVLQAYHSSNVIVTLREDPISRGASVMVILPRDRFSGEVRKGIEEVLVRELDGEVLNYHLAMGEGDQARLHFHMAAEAGHLASVSIAQLEETIVSLTRTWMDRVREGLEAVGSPPDEARRLAQRYGTGFSAEYQAATQPTTAVNDILELEAMARDGRQVSITLSEPVADPTLEEFGVVTDLVLFLRDERMVLSDFMPILEDAGLRVLAMTPYTLEGPDVQTTSVNVFLVQDPSGAPFDTGEAGDRLSEAILAVRCGDASSDSLNSLVVMAGLRWRQVEVLRAYANYGFQVGAVPSRFSFYNALKKYPDVARVLLRYFEARFDPGLKGGAEARAAEMKAADTSFKRYMRQVSLLADDRALRRLWALISATMRTNYFKHGGADPTVRSGGVPFISFKIHAPDIQEISAVRTRLLYEVWVRSSRMEGIHLRGARVARGGIRWSDRPDDFRTEVLGLVNTQMVKNAVIVPGGSKGGFVPLRRIEDRAEWAEDGREQYKTLIRGLLDVTDNLVKGRSVRPKRVVCHDEPDPYLVVAADKGTAKFSDVANGVSEEYGFWLDDAFASGGSYGYDHKVCGITARGGWESVKRHFRENGKDIQSEPFTVVGIGDMSGDVFGNGMLLSKQIRLLAAFDHRHIFVDPDPDPAASWRERNRMFKLQGSSWEDYRKDLISDGGFVVPRSSKSVKITPQAREALGIPGNVKTLDGESLIRHILMSPAELLWNGGIGTYVKASFETHADAGDTANDAVRIDATDLRVQVVGEGGNLGLTQSARVEYAMAGGRINTDALDNSGGVDMSDHEVNLKVLLGSAVAAGSLSMDDRNALLEKLTDEEVELVLANNDSQSLAVSLDEIRTVARADDFIDLVALLEREGTLDRRAERLPTWEELAERIEEHERGLTRPELSVLLAYAKLQAKASILGSDLTSDEALGSYLLDYFPAEAVEAAGGEEALQSHRLRSEIIATLLTNEMVDMMGATFVHRVSRDTGREPWEVARAWLIASRLAGHRDIIQQLKAVRTELPSEVIYRWVLGLARVLERTSRWVLANIGPDLPVAACVDRNLEGLRALRSGFAKLAAGLDRARFNMLVEELTAAGAKPRTARSLISLRFLDQLLEILELSHGMKGSAEDAARAYYRVSEAFGAGWIRRSLQAAAGDDRWEQREAHGLVEQVARSHADLAGQILRRSEKAGGVDKAAKAFLDGMGQDLVRYQQLLEEIQLDEEPSLSALWAATRELRTLAGRA
jgi:glutamate dehydrogenase